MSIISNFSPYNSPSDSDPNDTRSDGSTYASYPSRSSSSGFSTPSGTSDVGDGMSIPGSSDTDSAPGSPTGYFARSPYYSPPAYTHSSSESDTDSSDHRGSPGGMNRTKLKKIIDEYDDGREESMQRARDSLSRVRNSASSVYDTSQLPDSQLSAKSNKHFPEATARWDWMKKDHQKEVNRMFDEYERSRQHDDEQWEEFMKSARHSVTPDSTAVDHSSDTSNTAYPSVSGVDQSHDRTQSQRDLDSRFEALDKIQDEFWDELRHGSGTEGHKERLQNNEKKQKVFFDSWKGDIQQPSGLPTSSQISY
ncbi:uncharacterized protein IL334_006750 [Kwoniella shivajii]|uniref:Uncharacterized protein n=1 Tax=Kwoniella shivajii TaxID=564305 RepID=A0ABZ1D6U0_9TREE|nr:hypothetical protein IL334_006750 [Kwoniella shivajii]